jgi:hypothetical protein
MKDLLLDLVPSLDDLQNATIVLRFIGQIGAVVLTGGLLVRRARRWARRREARRVAESRHRG